MGYVSLRTVWQWNQDPMTTMASCYQVTCEDVVIILSFKQWHLVGGNGDLWNLSVIKCLHLGKLREIRKKNKRVIL